jgi:hypothetical protein
LIFQEFDKSKKIIKNGKLNCLGSLTKVLGNKIKNEIASILNLLFIMNLSTELISTLTLIVENIPSLLELISSYMIDEFSLILFGTKYNEFDIKKYKKYSKNEKEVLLAIKYLRIFNFQKFLMIDLAYNISNIYFDDINENIRKESLITCFELLNKDENIVEVDKFVNFCLEKILILCITDISSFNRYSILNSIKNSNKFDIWFSKIENIKKFLILLNDENIRFL